MRVIPAILAAALAASPACALACTVPAGYVPPTNWQLAGEANMIVLGDVVGGGVGTPADPTAPSITVHPLVALKGLLPGADFQIGGATLATSGDAAPPAAQDPLAFAPPDPASLGGDCIRRTFAPNARVLFFLKRVNGEWVPAGGPLSRWAQDVAGLDAPWVGLASVYAHAAMLPGEDGRQLLEQRREALVSRPAEQRAAAAAADIERSLAGPAPPVIAEIEPEPSNVAADAAQAPDEPTAPTDLGEVQQAIDSFGKDR
jgi:hypothetical protein